MLQTRTRRILILISILLIGLIIIYFGYVWFLNKHIRVLNGTASPDFPYRDYSDEELNKLYPQEIVNTAATVQTPEQTHKKFIDALKKEDFDQAVQCCFRKGDWEMMKTGLQKVKEKGELGQMIKDLDTEIKPELVNENSALYNYYILKNGEKIGSDINFIKSSNGIWLIKSL